MGARLTCLAVLVAALTGCGGPGEGAQRAGGASDRARVLDYKLEGWRTDFSRHTVPLDEFLSGGPPKDGIPAIDHPRFRPAAQVGFLRPREPVIELVVHGQARAYPIQILIWHEIVNDSVAGVPVTVTFCPLCNTAIAFDRRLGGETLSFGTTGKLRNSDLVMYDRETESWWQQFGGAALVGRYAGARLGQLPARIVSWQEFGTMHPRALVLDRPTGEIARPYGANPYEGYDDVGSPPIFPTANSDDTRLAPKERVVFLARGGEAAVLPYSTLQKRRDVRVEVGGHHFVVRWRPGVSSPLDSDVLAGGREVGSVQVLEDGRPTTFEEPFWFVVAAFRPDARIIR